MTGDHTAPPDDGPPDDGPPDDGPPDAVPEDVAGYVSYLKSAGQPADGAREDVSLRTAGWRFCYLGPAPGVRASSMACHPDRLPVRADRDSEWWELLSERGLDAGRAHQLVAWLMERPAPVGPGSPSLNGSEAVSVVTPPALTVDGERATFRGWVVYPPNMGEPFLVSLDARKGAATSLTTTRWDRAEAQ